MIIAPGIYRIQNTKNGDFYIGSSVNMSTRWCHHKKGAIQNSKKSPHLYSAMRKYGIENFIITPILICEKSDLHFYEQKFLDIYVGKSNCYNCSRDAAAPMRNASAETRQKLSESISKGRKGIAPWNKGIPRTIEEKLKISEATKLAMSKIKIIIFEETKLKLSIAMKDRKFSKETLKKMSAAKKGLATWNKRKAHPTSAILNENQVREIRSKYIPYKYSANQLGKDYNVHPSTIHAILDRKTWNHIT